MNKSEWSGYLYILVGATLWGVSSVIAKALFNIGLPPAELILVRLTLATFIHFIILLFYARRRIIISPTDLPYFLILGGVAVTGMNFLFLYDQQNPCRTGRPPSVSSTDLGLPLCFSIPEGTNFQEKDRRPAPRYDRMLSGRRWLSMDLLRLNKVGNVSGLIASFFFTFYALYGEKGLKKYDPWTLILYGFGFSTICYMFQVSPIKIIQGNHPLKVWIAFLYIAIFSTLIPFGFYFKGMERIRATRASITATWEPVIAGFAAYLVLGEVLYPLQFFGGIAMIAAIVLLQISREKTTPSNSFGN